MEKMAELMANLRENPPTEIGDFKVVEFADYIAGTNKIIETGETISLTLPKSDVLSFKLTDGASVIIRPSGTEPKVKSYYTTKAETHEEAVALEEKLRTAFKAILGV